MKHTPGPWEVSKYCHGKGVASQLGVTPAKIANVWDYRIYRNETDVEADHNARLIAAAPEMLAALEGIHTFGHDEDDLQMAEANGVDEVVVAMPLSVYRAIVAAIAKAKGAN